MDGNGPYYGESSPLKVFCVLAINFSYMVSVCLEHAISIKWRCRTKMARFTLIVCNLNEIK